MLVTVIARYTAGGPPGPTYRGTECFMLNVDSNATDNEVFEAAKSRATARVAGKYVMPMSQVAINGVDLSREDR